jgi:hypothetical protein
VAGDSVGGRAVVGVALGRAARVVSTAGVRVPDYGRACAAGFGNPRPRHVCAAWSHALLAFVDGGSHRGRPTGPALIPTETNSVVDRLEAVPLIRGVP